MFDSSILIKKINEAISKIDNDLKQSLVLPRVAALISDAIDRNFDYSGAWDGNISNINLFSGGSKKWKELAQSTKNSYSRTKLGITPRLYRTGNLKRNIEVGVKNNSIYIASNAPYSRFHQFGTSSIPARPFIVLTQEDMEEIYQVILESLG